MFSTIFVLIINILYIIGFIGGIIMIETLNGIHETVNYKADTNIRLYNNKEYEDYPTHWHSPIEIILPTENDYSVICGNHEFNLRQGDILIIAPGVIHSLYAPEEGNRIIFQANCSVISGIKELETVLSLISPALLFTPEEFPYVHEELCNLLLSIRDEYFSNEFLFEASVYSQLIEIFIIIGRNHVEKQKKYDMGDLKHIEYIEKFFSICDYIGKNCTTDLTLEEVADFAGFSKYHFSRLFKQFTGQTFYKFLSEKRINHAEKLLISPDISITEVALQSGFTSLSAFNRMFKIIKSCTPTEYRCMYSMEAF